MNRIAFGSYVVEESSGSIASFDDGADGIPMKDVLVHIEPMQEGSGDPSPDNIRPITGWTACEVIRTGKNLLDTVAVNRTHRGVTYAHMEDGSISVIGTATSNTSYSTDFGKKTFKAGTYTLSVTGLPSGTRVAAINETTNDTVATTTTISSFTLRNDTPIHCYIAVNKDIVINTTAYVQIEFGSTATDYEPYSGQTYDITFPTEAGTVYGGTLDVTKGELVVDRASIQANTIPWVKNSGQNNPNGTYFNTETTSVPFVEWKNGGMESALSNVFVRASSAGNQNTEKVNSFWWNNTSTGYRCIWGNAETSTLTDFMQFLTDNNVIFIGKIATPITYQLTPQEITSLLGENTLWADTGNSEVTYCVNPTLLLDNESSEIQSIKSMIAGVESSAVATKNYSIGDLVIVEDTLYEVTAAIASGETISASKVRVTTVDDVIRNRIADGVDDTLTQAEQAADAKVVGDEITGLKSGLNERIDFTDSYVMTPKPVTLPESVRGNFNFKKNDDNDLMISGTNNVAQLLNIKKGTFDINGITIIVDGNTVSVSGQPTADFNFHFESGTKKTATELTAMTLGLPEHIYTLSQKVTSGTVFPSILIRSKTSGNVSVAQNNTNVFTMDKTTCGGFYMLLQANKNYSCSFDIALLPYSTNSGNKFRNEISNISVYDNDGTYPLDGYTWIVGNPTVTYLESLLPKKPKCRYSLRTIDYSNMTECLDVYIPASNGYINYVFGHTENAVSGGNVWRLVQVDAVNDALVYSYHITQLGETEMAIHIKNRDDFIGGTTHGDEIMDANSLLFVIDGKPTDITTITDLTEFKTLQCFLVSDMYDPADHTTLVGKHGREWKFDNNGLYIGQTVEFLADLTLENSYMPMLCALRGNDTASALQVTDTYTDDGNYQQYDVSTGGFTTYPNTLKTDVREINLFGRVSGVKISLQIIEQPEGLNKEGTFLYNGVNTYNKIYCCLCGYGGGANTQNVSNGDKWKVKSQIMIDIGN